VTVEWIGMHESDNGNTHWDEARYSEFVAECYRYLNAAQDRAKEEFRLGSYQRFDWDQEKGTLVFSDAGIAKVVAALQFVGSISKRSGTWLWSWANATVLPNIKDRIEDVRAFGERRSLTELTTAKWNATEEDGWAMTAVTSKLLQAKGAYRSPDQNGFSFFVFTDIWWADKN
jgi:hypothetical protein